MKGEKTSKVRILRLKSKKSSFEVSNFDFSRKTRTLLVFSPFKSQYLQDQMEMTIFVRLETCVMVFLKCVLDMSCLGRNPLNFYRGKL